MEYLVVCMLVLLPTIDCLIGGLGTNVEDLPFQVMQGSCYFNSKHYYSPGQLEIKVVIDTPTVDLHVSIVNYFNLC
jgi:hypothetical protein